MLCACVFAIGVTSWAASPSNAANNFNAALSSITGDELYDHAAVLADDVYEGRLTGTRGARAAARYLIQELRRYSLQPAGENGGYLQPCDDGVRNILALWPGSDPVLKDEVIVVGAHYDHVGDGSRGHVRGAIGRIYNGADDNASGVSVLLETIEALSNVGLDTRRSILFVFWDGEEMGMLGSHFWLAHPTVPLDEVPLSINVDMVGRLRDGRLLLLGTRSGFGLRRLFSGPLDDALWLDFSWQMQANSDHWPFLERHIPTVTLHTGLHENYHRPTDDPETLNREGMQAVARYLLAALVRVADADELPRFRDAGLRETMSLAERRQRPLRPLSLDHWPANLPPPRLGISWRGDPAEPGAVYLTRVVPGTPAADAGLEVLDRIYAVDGLPFADKDQFERALFGVLDAGEPHFVLLVESRGHVHQVSVTMPPAAPSASI